MSAAGPTSLSLFAAAIYACVVLSCLAAALVAVRTGQVRSHAFVWSALAVLFAMLVFLRVTNGEEVWRDALRSAMRGGGYYDSRREMQRPLIAALAIIAMVAVPLWISRAYRLARSRRDTALAIAQLGALLMLGTISLRMVSFSPIDKLLYGPLKLNWIGDLGSALLVGGCAACYIHLAMRSSRRRRPR